MEQIDTKSKEGLTAKAIDYLQDGDGEKSLQLTPAYCKWYDLRTLKRFKGYAATDEEYFVEAGIGWYHIFWHKGEITYDTVCDCDVCMLFWFNDMPIPESLRPCGETYDPETRLPVPEEAWTKA